VKKSQTISHFLDRLMFFNRVVNEFVDGHGVAIREDRTWGGQLSQPRVVIRLAAAQRLAASRIIDDALARAIPVLALVHWIGGLSAVTTIVLPRAQALPNPADAVAAFDAFERRFARQVRVSIFLVGLSGVYMIMKFDGWDRFGQASFWWLDLMVTIWALFASMVYVLEPLLIYRLFHDFALR
jgi:uncharacterized membrane protein